MQNRLAEHLTTWKFWYAIPASAALLITSLLPAVAGMFMDPESASATTVMSAVAALQFIALAALALGFIALFERSGPQRATSASPRASPRVPSS